MTPAFLLGGSITCTTSISDWISTFRSFGVSFFIAFDLAFMMFGRVAYLGWFNLKSVLQRRMQQKTNPQNHRYRHHTVTKLSGKSKRREAFLRYYSRQIQAQCLKATINFSVHCCYFIFFVKYNLTENSVKISDGMELNKNPSDV